MVHSLYILGILVPTNCCATKFIKAHHMQLDLCRVDKKMTKFCAYSTTLLSYYDIVLLSMKTQFSVNLYAAAPKDTVLKL